MEQIRQRDGNFAGLEFAYNDRFTGTPGRLEFLRDGRGGRVLDRSRVELDYLSSPPRAVFSCESDEPRAKCFAAARCPRLPDPTDTHLCFGLESHGYAPVCTAAASGC